MDLSLLHHLSDDGLRAEADMRGLDVNGLDRAAIIEAIRSAEGLPRQRQAPLTASPTSTPSRPSKTLGTARTLLGRVVSLARNALERRPESTVASSASETDPDEPIATRTMAKLLIQQGHWERARGILRQLAHERPNDAELIALCRTVEQELADRALQERLDGTHREGAFVEIAHVPTGRGVIWRVDEATHARAAAVLGGKGTLTLRVIEVAASPEHVVERRQMDHAPIDRDGCWRVDTAPGARLVVSIGLADEDRFVSALHTAS